jgi:beta-lactamase regulating signal transducer with metallopeptidase domain
MPVVWAAGVPYTLAMLAAGLLGAHRLRQHGAPLTDGPHKASLDRLRRLMGIRRGVALALFDGVRAPVLLGLLKPVILLPAALLTDLTPQQLELLLIHELAHVRRWDNLVNLLQRLAEGVLFFHPAVWAISRRLRLERELCCDATVLRYANRPRMYVLTLASLAAPAAALRCAPAADGQPSTVVARPSNPQPGATRHAYLSQRFGPGPGRGPRRVHAAGRHRRRPGRR